VHETTQLWLFFVVVLGVIALPGLDMAFVLASALVGGRRSGFAATAGIVAGGVVHVTLGALGIVAVLQLVPAAFNVVLLAGAAYIAWIGVGLLASRAAFAAPARGRDRTRAATFRQGMVTSLLNPKAYLFTLAVLPQFMKPEYGSVGAQAIVLWLIIALTQVAVYGGLALAGDRARAWFAARPSVNLLLARGVGTLLLATAAYTALEGWRSGAGAG
jgi:threonine/homoserine/homoserine lactone efflux protein